jgi:hypothetical protein
MTTPVSDVLLAPANRPRAVTVLTQVIDQEVATKRGLSGTAVKAAYGAVRRMGGDLVPRATRAMLPDFARALDPFWAAKGDSDFGGYLASRPDQAGTALLAVTDGRAGRTRNQALARVYGSMRDRAMDHVVAALPRLGQAVSSLMEGAVSRPAPGGGEGPATR